MFLLSFIWIDENTFIGINQNFVMNKSLKKGNDNRKCLRRFSIMKQTNKESQTINCTVTSCKYKNGQRQLCELEHIIVTPVQGCQTTQPDESMCSSYKNIDNNK